MNIFLEEAVSRLAAKVFEELQKTITNPLELKSKNLYFLKEILNKTLEENL